MRELTTKQMMVCLLKRAELLNGEFSGYFLGKKQIIKPETIQIEIKRRESISPRWRFED